MPIAGWRALSEVSDTSAAPAEKCRPACLITRKPPVRHTSTTERNWSASSSVIRPKPLKPAQLTTTCRPPSRATTPSNRAATLSSSVTSTAAQACGSPSSAARAAAPSLLRSAIVTRAPSPARTFAVAQPIPEAPPMTTATRLSAIEILSPRKLLAQSSCRCHLARSRTVESDSGPFPFVGRLSRRD